MANKATNILKQYFETGDKPTQQQFEHLIDTTIGTKIRFPKHASLTTGDVGKLVMNDGGFAKVSTAEPLPSAVVGEIEFEFLNAPDPPVGDVWSIDLGDKPVDKNWIRIGYKTFYIVTTATLENEIEHGANLASALTNICAKLNNTSFFINSGMLNLTATNDGVSLLTLDFSDPLRNANHFDQNPFQQPEYKFRIAFDYSFKSTGLPTSISTGSKTFWNNTYNDDIFFTVFGVQISLFEILDEVSMTPADHTIARGFRWANDATIFADAIETVLSSKSADITFTRTGNKFTVNNVNNVDKDLGWEFVIGQTFQNYPLSYEANTITEPIADNEFEIVKRPILGSLVEIDDTIAVINVATTYLVTLGGTTSATAVNDLVSGELSATTICFATNDGKVETLQSAFDRADAESALLSDADNSKLVLSKIFIPLESGSVGDRILCANGHFLTALLFGK